MNINYLSTFKGSAISTTVRSTRRTRSWLLIVLFCLGSLYSTGQSNHTVSFSGSTGDFFAAERYGSVDNVDYYVSYDASYVYFGAFRTGGSSWGNFDHFTVYIDTDPTATVSSGGNGTTTGVNWDGNTPTQPFMSDYRICVRPGGAGTGESFKSTYSGGWTTNGANASGWSQWTNTAANGAMEVRVPWSDLGNPDAIYFNLYCSYNTGFFGAAPGGTSGGAPSTTNYFGGIGVSSADCIPINITNTPITASITNGVPVAGALYGKVTVNAGTVTASNNFNLAPGGSIVVSGGTFDISGRTIQLGGATIGTGRGTTINTSGAGVLTTSSTTVLTGNGETNIVGNNLTYNGTFTLNRKLTPLASGGLTFSSTGILDLRASSFLNTNAPTYAAGSTLQYNTGGAFGAGTEWTANAASGVGVPSNVTIGNVVANSTVNFGASAQYRQATGNILISNATAGAGLTLSTAAGGDLRVGGNFTNNGTYTHNTRGITFNGTAAQAIAGTLNNGTAATNILTYVTIANTSANVTANTTVNIGNNLTINAGARLDIGTNTLVLNSGLTSSVLGFLRSAGTITTTGALTIGTTGTYEDNHPYAAVALGPIPTATWSAGSTCSIIGAANPTAGTWFSAGATQTFSNFTWNTLSLSTAPNMGGATLTATGTFTMASTGSSELRLGTNSSGMITVGNFTQTGGTINMASGTGTGTLNCSGTFNQSAGTINESSTGSGVINFTGTGTTQTVTQSGTVSNDITWNVGTGAATNIQLLTNITTSGTAPAFVVKNNASIDFGLFIITGTASFNANSGSKLISANTNATGTFTTSGANGSVQSSGTRTFTNTGVSYTFNGTSAQSTGNAIGVATNITNLTISNSSGVILTSPATLSATGTLLFTAGSLDIAANNLTLASGATISGAGTGKYVKTTGAGQLKQTVAGTQVAFPVGNSAYNPILLTNSGTSDVYGIRVLDGALSGTNDITKTINRSWNITETVAGGSNLNVVATYNSGEENNAGAFAAAVTPKVGIYNGTIWSDVTATAAGTTFTATANFLPADLTTAQSIGLGKDDGLAAPILPPTINASGGVVASAPGSGTSGYVGNTITINGTNLLQVTIVKVGGAGGTTVSILSQTATTLTFSAINLGGQVYVQNSGGNATSTETYTNLGYITTAGASAWNTASSWLGGVVPATGSDVTIAHALNIAAITTNSPLNSVKINTGITATINNAAGSLTVTNAITTLGTGVLTYTAAGAVTAGSVTNNGTLSWTAGGTLTVTTGGSLTNSGTFTQGTSTVTFNGAGTITGTYTFYNLIIGGAIANSATLTVNNNLQLNTGATLTNAPTYGAASTLLYNQNATINNGNEWVAGASGAGVPQNVTVQNSTILTLTGGSAYTANGNVNISSGTLALSVTAGGDLNVKGNWSRAGTFTHNNRTVTFNGTALAQTINNTNTFYGLVIDNSTASGVTAGSTQTIANTIVINASRLYQIGGGINHTGGAGTTFTVNGTLQINNGGFVTNAVPAPVYGSSSTLIYNTTSNPYGMNNEWLGNSNVAGAGVPQNVIIQNTNIVAFPAVANGSRGCAGNFTISSGGATLGTNGTNDDLYVGGNFTNNGAFTHNTRAIFLNGTGATQTLNGTLNNTGAATNCLPYLFINNSNGASLNAAVSVTSQLALTSGKITLNGFNLTLSSGATITSVTSTNYVQTNGAGQLKQTVAASAILFPVGNSAYDPFTMTNTGTSDIYGVRVTDGTPPSPWNATKVVNRSWVVTEATAGGSNLAVTAQWNSPGEEAASFASGVIEYIGLYNGSVWLPNGATSAGSTFTSTSNFTSVGTFACGKDDAFRCSTAVTFGSSSSLSGYTGDVLTITGTNFTAPVVDVQINGVSGSFSITNATTLTVTVPGGITSLSGNIVVYGCGYAATSPAFTYTGYITANSGPWSTAATWRGNIIPSNGGPVTINTGHNVTLDMSADPSALTINSTATLLHNNNTYTLGSANLATTNISGTLTLDDAITPVLLSTDRFKSTNVNILASGALTNNSGIATAVNVANLNVANSGTYTHNAVGSVAAGVANDFPGSTTRVFGASSNVVITKWANGSAPVALPTITSPGWGNLTINVASLGGDWDQGGALALVQGNMLVQATGGGSNVFWLRNGGTFTGTTTITGSLTVSGGNFTCHKGTTVNYNTTVSGNLVVNGTANFSVTGGSTNATAAPLLTVTGSATVGGSSIFSNTGTVPSYIMKFGSLDVTGTSFFRPSTSSTNVPTVQVTGAMTVTGGTAQHGSGTTYTYTLGSLSISSGSFDPSGSSSSTLNMTTGSITISGTGSFAATNGGSTTITCTGNFIQSSSANPAFTFYANTPVSGKTYKLDLGGNLDISNGVFRGGSITTTGSAASVNFTGGTASVLFKLTGGSIDNTTGRLNFTVASGKTVTMNNSLPGSSTASYPWTFTVSNGGTLDCGTSNVISGNTNTSFSLAAGGTLITANTGGVLGSITCGTTSFTTGANYVFNGSSPQVTSAFVAGTTSGSPYSAANVTVNNAQGVTLQLFLSVSSKYNALQGVFTLGNFDMTWASAIDLSGSNAFSATNMIATNSGFTGFLKHSATASQVLSSFIFPIGETDGTTEYSPIQFTAGSANAAGTIGFRVTDAVHPSMSPATEYITRYWDYTDNNSVVTNGTFKATYINSAADITGTEANMRASEYIPSLTAWQDDPSSTPSASTITFTAPALPFVSGYQYTARATTTVYYRSIATGLWSNPNTWETSTVSNFASILNSPALTAPNYANSAGITVRNTPSVHTVTVDATSASLIVDQLTVDGILTVNTTSSFTVRNGTGTDLSVSSTGTVNLAAATGGVTLNPSTATVVDGYFKNSLLTPSTTFSGAFTFNNASTYELAGDGGTIPAATWNGGVTGSTCLITGLVATSSIGITAGQAFHHVTFNCPGQNTASLQILGDISTINGNLTMAASGNKQVRLFGNNASTNASSLLTIGGNLIVTGGSLALVNSTSATATANCTIRVKGDVLVSGGTLDMTGNSANTAAGSNLEIEGNMSVTGAGTIVRTQATPSTITFLKSTGTQTFASTAGGVSGGIISWFVGNGTTTNTVQMATTNWAINTAASLTVRSAATLDILSEWNVNGGTFTLAAGATSGAGGTLRIGSQYGITTAAASATSGNIQTTTRTFNNGATYVYAGTLNQVTGNALPSNSGYAPSGLANTQGPVTINLTIDNTGTAGNNTVTLTTNNTHVDLLTLKNGLFAAGTGQTINITDMGAITGTGGNTVTGATAGTIFCKDQVTVNGTPNLYNITVQGYAPNGTEGALGDGTNFINNATITNSLQINTTGSVVGNSPKYAVGSTLIYNTGGTYSRNIEWGNLPALAAGYPHNVTVQNGTVLDLNTNPVSPSQLEMGGNLVLGNTLGSGQMYMNNSMAKALVVMGDVTIGNGLAGSGILGLSSVAGGDLKIQGSYTRYSNGTLTHNGRAVFFIGATNGTFTASGGETLPYVFVQKTAAANSVTMNSALNVTTTLNISQGILDAQTNTLNGTGNVTMTGGTLQMAKNNTLLPELTGTYSLTGGTVIFYGNGTTGATGPQTIRAVNYYNLTSSSTGGRTLSSAGVTGIANVLTPGTNTYTVTGSSVDFNGTVAQNIPGLKVSAYPYLNQYNILTVSNGNTKSITDNFTILDSLKIKTATTLNLSAGDTITIKSDAAKTARVGMVEGSLTYASTGKFRVERFIPPHRAWRILTAPVVGQTISQAWQEGYQDFSTGTSTGIVGYGTKITADVNATVANGYDQKALNASLYTYQYKGSSWSWSKVPSSTKIPTTTTPMTVSADNHNNAYIMFVRGDRYAPLTPYTSGTNTVLRPVGTLMTGNQTVALSGIAGARFIGNPFASEVNIRKFTIDANLKAPSGDINYYLWDSRGATNGYGAYITFTEMGPGSGHFIYVPSNTYSAPDTINRWGNIESGSAFGLYYNGSGTQNVIIKEADKIDSSSNVIFKRPVNVITDADNTTSYLRVNLYAVDADNSPVLADGVMTIYNNIYLNEVNLREDAKKLNNFGENLSMFSRGEYLAIEKRKPIAANDTIFLAPYNMKQQSYSLEFIPENMERPDLVAFLEDLYKNTRTPVALNAATTIKIDIDADPASKSLNRFRVVFGSPGGGTVPVTLASLKAWQKDDDIAVEWKVANELNIREYEVEKSMDGRHFAKVNTTTARDNSSSTLIYNWLDKKVAIGANYYRIRIVENNGATKYSQVVKVIVGKGVPGIAIYPNPVKGNLIKLQMNSMPTGLYEFRLVNSLGQVLMTRSVYHDGNPGEIIPLPKNVTPGMYELEVIHPDKTKSIDKLFRD